MTMTVTPPALSDVLDPALLDAMVEQGFVRAQRHPTLPLVIYNYTEACQFAGVWNAATLACRGLIVDDAARTVVARPFEKFFMRLDGRDYRPLLWQRSRPEPQWTPHGRTLDPDAS